MDENNMADNKTTLRVDGTRYRKIPNFTNYGISAAGRVINLTTRKTLSPSDFDHWTGRYCLYNKSEKTKFNTESLISMTWGKDRVERFRSLISV